MKNSNTETKKTTTKATAEKAVAIPTETTSMNPPEVVEMSTDVFSKEMLTELNKRTKAIKNCIGKIDSSFETIAFNLYWINSKEAYKAQGCDSITSYSKEFFGYEKTTCYSLISVVERFAKRDGNGAILEQLDDKVKGFSVSKLSLMVGLTEQQIESLKPDMTVKEIKKYVKSLEGKALPELSEGNGEEEETEESAETSGNTIVDSTAKEINRQVLISCKGVDDYNSKVDKIDDFILCALKAHPDAVIEIAYVLP